MNKIEYGSYEEIEEVHNVAVQNGWIVIMGYDETRAEYSLSIIGKIRKNEKGS
jgi:hypothetical protein